MLDRPRRAPAHFARRRAWLGLGRRPALAIGLALLLGSPALAVDPDFVVIVNRANPVQSIDRGTLVRYFLKKTTRWPDESPVLPVDLPADSPVRERFSREILGRSARSIKNYWQQLIFSGRGVPPPELGSSDAVVEYVEKNRGAIGYVSAGVDLGQARAVGGR